MLFGKSALQNKSTFKSALYCAEADSQNNPVSCQLCVPCTPRFFWRKVFFGEKSQLLEVEVDYFFFGWIPLSLLPSYIRPPSPFTKTCFAAPLSWISWVRARAYAVASFLSFWCSFLAIYLVLLIFLFRSCLFTSFYDYWLTLQRNPVKKPKIENEKMHKDATKGSKSGASASGEEGFEVVEIGSALLSCLSKWWFFHFSEIQVV